MITVSTTSEHEARAAAAALDQCTPPDVGWTVYLGGKLFREREIRPASRPDLSWANPETGWPAPPGRGWPSVEEKR